jgi:hypothetical protein
MNKKQILRRNGVSATMLSAQYPNGSRLRWVLTANNEQLKLKFTSDAETQKKHEKLVKQWLMPKKGEMKFQRIDRFEKLLRMSSDEQDLIARISSSEDFSSLHRV